MTQSGDVLIVEEDDEPKTFKKGQIESESEADTDGSLSTDSDEPDLPAVEDHGDDHNLAALKPLKDIAITGVEIDDDDDDVIKKKPEQKKKKLTRKERNKIKKNNRTKMMNAMVIPDITVDRERERKLIHIATKGVVTLFNKVSEKQAELRKKEEVEKKKLKEKKPIIGKLEPGGAPARPPLSKLLNIQVPLGPPSKKIKKEDENDDEDMRTDGEDVIAIDTDTDAVQVISEAEVKTEAESD